MEILFKRIRENATIPTKATELSGGWDVTVSEIEKKADDFYICKLGWEAALPVGYKLTLVPRSSLTNTKWILQNSPGLGDSDYRGEYQFRFRAIPEILNIQDICSTHSDESSFRVCDFVTPTYPNKQDVYLTYPEFPFKVGDRIGQVYLEEVIPICWTEVDTLPTTIRGSGGFGSTGK